MPKKKTGQRKKAEKQRERQKELRNAEKSLAQQPSNFLMVCASTCRTCVYFEFPLIMHMRCILYFETIDVLENIDFIIYKKCVSI